MPIAPGTSEHLRERCRSQATGRPFRRALENRKSAEKKRGEVDVCVCVCVCVSTVLDEKRWWHKLQDDDVEKEEKKKKIKEQSMMWDIVLTFVGEGVHDFGVLLAHGYEQPEWAFNLFL